jgi:hypothetical protein
MRYAELAGITLSAYYECIGDYGDSFVRVWNESVIIERTDVNSDNYCGEPHYLRTDAVVVYYDTELINKIYFDPHDIARDDPILVRIVEEMGDAVNTYHSKLKIAEIPDGVIWEIGEDDTGYEWVQEKPRKWI